MLLSSDKIPLKSTRTAGGVQLMNLKGAHVLTLALCAPLLHVQDPAQYRKYKIPSAGSLLHGEIK